MPLERTIIIGDVHGCLAELKALLVKISYDPKTDRVIFLGDLIDKGPSGPEVLRFVRNNRFECIIGNHENKLIRFKKHEDKRKKESTYENPVQYTEKQIEDFQKFSREDFDWLFNLKRFIYLKEKNLFLVHAGTLPESSTGKNPFEQPSHVHFYARYVNKNTLKMHKKKIKGACTSKPLNAVYWFEAYDGKQNIVFGHNVISLNEPTVKTNSHGVKTFALDTGLVYGGHLSAMVICMKASHLKYEFVKQKAFKKYFQ